MKYDHEAMAYWIASVLEFGKGAALSFVMPSAIFDPGVK